MHWITVLENIFYYTTNKTTNKNLDRKALLTYVLYNVLQKTVVGIIKNFESQLCFIILIFVEIISDL